MYKVTTRNKQVEVNFKDGAVTLDGTLFDWDISKIDDSQYHVIKDDRSYTMEVIKIDYESKMVALSVNGRKYEISVKDKLDVLLEKLGMDKAAGPQLNEIKAPMPGLILAINVKEGDLVKKGDTLLILEAMKMENVIKAPGDGEVKQIKAKVSDSVEKNEVIIQF